MDFDEAIRLQPDYAIAYNGRGKAKSNLGDKQGAILDYREVMRLCKQENDMEKYDKALKQIENLEKGNKGFLGRLFS